MRFEHEKNVRFGLPYFEQPGIYADERWGFVGAVVLSTMSYIIFILLISPIKNNFVLQTPVDFESMVIALFYSLLLVHLSQMIAGASFTKFALDFAVIAISFLLITAFNNLSQLTFWNVFPTYLTIIFGLISIGGLWIQYRLHKKEKTFFEQKKEIIDTTTYRLVSKDRATHGSTVPTFSVAYFGISTGYLLIGSMILLLSRGGV